MEIGEDRPKSMREKERHVPQAAACFIFLLTLVL